MYKDVKEGRYIKLQPKVREGIIKVGGRTERWIEATWNKQEFVLLTKEQKLSKIIAVYEHNNSVHLGIAATLSKI